MPVSIQVVPPRLGLIEKTLNSKFANKGVGFVKNGKLLREYRFGINNPITPQLKEDILSRAQQIATENPESGIYLKFFA